MFFLHIVDLHLFGFRILGVMGSQAGRLLESAVRHFVSAGLYDNVGAGRSFGVEPPVVPCGKVESQFIVLEIILPDIHVIAVRRNIVEWLTGDLDFLFGKFAPDVSGRDQLFLELRQVVLPACHFQCIYDGFQIGDLVVSLLNQTGQCFIGPLLLVLFLKIAGCIFLWSLLRIQRNRNHFIGVIVERFQLLSAFLQIVAVGMDQFPVNFEFVPVLCVP